MDASRGSGAIFPMPQIPALLYPPPPPRPLPSSALSLTSSSSSRHAPSITSFPILVLTVLGILTTSVLLLAYYVFVIRCCLNWHASSSSSRRGRRRRQQRASSTTGISLPGSSSGDPAEARGLDEAAIQALPAFRYSRKKSAAGGGTTTTNNDAAGAGSAPASECAVCLGEFEDGERVRMLPACLHVFHVACIDTWLQGNANCPLCRADTATHCVLPLQEPGHGRLRRPQDQEVVIIQLVPGAQEEEAARAQAQQRVAANAAAESTGEAAAAADHHQVGNGNSDKRKSIGAWHEIDISSREDDECTAKSKGDGDVDLVLPLRKSISMGRTTADEEVHLQIHNILQRNNIISSPSRGDDHDSDSSSSSSSV